MVSYSRGQIIYFDPGGRLVTSNYHVYRALRYRRRIGLRMGTVPLGLLYIMP